MPFRTKHALAAAATLVAGISSQPSAPRKLGAPTAVYDQEFTGIDGVRELKDGRVLVLDAKDKALHLVDFKSMAGRRLGREGDGPGEFRLLQEFFRAPGDTLALSDMGRFGKLLVITPSGEVGGFISMTDSALSTRAFNPRASDDAGRLYSVDTKNPFTDSTAIVRWDRTRGRRDTVAKYMATPVSPLYKGPPEMLQMPRGGGYAYRPGPIMPFATANQWAVAGDGRIALVDAQPYRVTYVNVIGVRVRGQPIPFSPIPVTDAEKAAFRADVERPRAFIGMRNGQMEAGFRKGTYQEPPEWPPSLPAFAQQALTFASDGMLWVRRNTRAGAPPLFDVIDRGGKVAFQLELPARTKVVGFGTGVVYLARVDDDDLHYLERYKLPGR